MICFYHKSDLDGKASAAIVKYRYPECELYGINYGENFPWNLLTSHHSVFMVDFTLKPFTQMLELNKKYQLFWIDHHKSAIEAWRDAESPPITGTRVIRKAACILTWEYVFPNAPIPKSIELIGKYDVWDHSSPEVTRFQYGISIEDCNPENQKMWKWLLNDMITSTYINKGYTVEKYVTQTDANICKAQTFITNFEEYHCLAVNRLFASSYFFKSINNINDYSILIMFGWMNGKWRVSLRSEKVNVAKVAKKFGGGGHVGAAGFDCDILPFSLTNLGIKS